MREPIDVNSRPPPTQSRHSSFRGSLVKVNCKFTTKARRWHPGLRLAVSSFALFTLETFFFHRTASQNRIILSGLDHSEQLTQLQFWTGVLEAHKKHCKTRHTTALQMSVAANSISQSKVCQHSYIYTKKSLISFTTSSGASSAI
jgi:hypothetical protein